MRWLVTVFIVSVFSEAFSSLLSATVHSSPPDTANSLLAEKLKTHDEEVSSLRKALGRLEGERISDLRINANLRSQLRSLKGVDKVLSKDKAEEPKLQHYIQAVERKAMNLKTHAAINTKAEEAAESKVDSFWHESESLQHENLALRASMAEASDAVNNVESEKRKMEANRTALETSVHKRDAQLAASLANTTSLRHEVALLVRQRQTFKSHAASLEALKPKLKEEDAEISKLASQVHALQSRLTKARASLLFGHSVQLRKEVSTVRKRNKELWTQQKQLDREILQGKAELQAAKAKAAKLKVALRHVQASAPLATKRVARLRGVDHRLAVEHNALVQSITNLQAKLHVARQENSELSHELDDLGPDGIASNTTRISSALGDSPSVIKNASSASPGAKVDQSMVAQHLSISTLATTPQDAGDRKNSTLAAITTLDDDSDDDDNDEDSDDEPNPTLPSALSAPDSSSPDLAALAASQGMSGPGTRVDTMAPTGRLWLPRNKTAAEMKSVN